MTRDQAMPYVAYVVDDGLSDAHHTYRTCLPDARLIGWQCGFEPVFVAVQSYLPNTRVDDEDAIEIATDYMTEIGWFAREPTEPDYVL